MTALAKHIETTDLLLVALKLCEDVVLRIRAELTKNCCGVGLCEVSELPFLQHQTKGAGTVLAHPTNRQG